MTKSMDMQERIAARGNEDGPYNRLRSPRSFRRANGLMTRPGLKRRPRLANAA